MASMAALMSGVKINEEEVLAAAAADSNLESCKTLEALHERLAALSLKLTESDPPSSAYQKMKFEGSNPVK